MGKQAKPEAVADNIQTSATPDAAPKPKPAPKPRSTPPPASVGFGPGR
jgi:hypothetical protein